MKNKTKKALCAASILGVVAISGIFAYLTDVEVAQNVFVVGNVDIELLEPAWDTEADPTLDQDGDTIPDFAQDVVPGQVIEKDPQVKNIGKNDAYVFVNVAIPRAQFTIVNDEGRTPSMIAVHIPYRDVFSYTYDDQHWGLLDTYTSDDDEYTYNIYYYKGELAVDATTEPLFNEVQVANIAGDSSYMNMSKVQSITIDAYAIQADELTDEIYDDGEGGTLTFADDEEEIMGNIYQIIANQRDL